MIVEPCVNWSELRDITGPCIRPGGLALTERALAACSLSPGCTIADIGCGAGGTLEHLERKGIYHLVGLDTSGTLLALAASRLAFARVIQGRAETLPFREASFDAIFCECVLSLVEDRAAALAEFARVLKQDGFAILSDVLVQSHSSPGRSRGGSRERSSKQPLAKGDLLELLTDLGFSLVLWEEHDRLIKEFVARLILAGERLKYLGECGLRRTTGRARTSYVLLIARKSRAAARPAKNQGNG